MLEIFTLDPHILLESSNMGISAVGSAFSLLGGLFGGGGGGSQQPPPTAPPSVFSPSPQGYLQGADVQVAGVQEAAQLAQLFSQDVLQNLTNTYTQAITEYEPYQIATLNAFDRLQDLSGLARPAQGSYQALLDYQQNLEASNAFNEDLQRQVDEATQAHLDSFRDQFTAENAPDTARQLFAIQVQDNTEGRAILNEADPRFPRGSAADLQNLSPAELSEKYNRGGNDNFEYPEGSFEFYDPETRTIYATDGTAAAYWYNPNSDLGEHSWVKRGISSFSGQDFFSPELSAEELAAEEERFRSQYLEENNLAFQEAPNYGQDTELTTPDPDSMLETLRQVPGFNFRMQQGIDAVQRAASARGLLHSGQLVKELTQFGQEFATSELNNEVQRLQGIVAQSSPFTAQQNQTLQQYGNAYTASLGQLGETLANASLTGSQAQASGILGASQQFYSAPLSGPGALQGPGQPPAVNLGGTGLNYSALGSFSPSALANSGVSSALGNLPSFTI